MAYDALHFGSSTQSGDGSTLIFTISHGVPGVGASSYVSVVPKTSAASGSFYVTSDATNITITYLSPSVPPSGTNNLIWAYLIRP